MQAAALAERGRREDHYREAQQIQTIAEFKTRSRERLRHIRGVWWDLEDKGGDERQVKRFKAEDNELCRRQTAAIEDEKVIRKRAIEVDRKALRAQQTAAIALEGLFVEHQLLDRPARTLPRTGWDVPFEKAYDIEQFHILAAEEIMDQDSGSEPNAQTRDEDVAVPKEQEIVEPDPELVARRAVMKNIQLAKYALNRVREDFDNRRHLMSAEEAEVMAIRGGYVEDLDLEELYGDPDARQLDHERKMTRRLIDAEEALYEAKAQARDLGIDPMSEVRYEPYDVAAMSEIVGEEVDRAKEARRPSIYGWTTPPDEDDVIASKEAEERQIADLEPYRADDADLDKVDHPAGPRESASQVAEVGDQKRLIDRWLSYTEALRSAGHENAPSVPLPMGI